VVPLSTMAILLVTVLVEDADAALGSVIVAVTASTGVSVVDPLVAPARTTVPISISLKNDPAVAAWDCYYYTAVDRNRPN